MHEMSNIGSVISAFLAHETIEISSENIIPCFGSAYLDSSLTMGMKSGLLERGSTEHLIGATSGGRDK